MMRSKNHTISGFSLIEILVTMTIIAVVMSVGLVSFSYAARTGRNAQRKQDLRNVQAALAVYKSVNGSYPSTGGSFYGSCSGFGSYGDTGASGYIPNLAPKYIQQLPHDPTEGKNTSVCNNAANTCYIYTSDGTNYKLVANCSPEGTLSPTDDFYDPTRPTTAWQISSSLTSRSW